MPKSQPCQCAPFDSRNVPPGPFCTVSSAFAGLSRNQPSMGSLMGVSMPHQLLCYRRHPTGHGPGGCQWNDPLRLFLMINVCYGVCVGPLSSGALYCVYCDLGLNLEAYTHVDMVERLPDIQDHRCMASSGNVALESWPHSMV